MLAKSKSWSIVPPRPEEAVEGSFNPPSVVDNAVLYVNEIGWSLLRSVPKFSPPPIMVEPVFPPKELRATVPS